MNVRLLSLLSAGSALAALVYFTPGILAGIASPDVKEVQRDRFEARCVTLNSKDGSLQLASFTDGTIYRNQNEKLEWRKIPEGYVVFDRKDGKEAVIGRIIPAKVNRYFVWHPAAPNQASILMKSDWGRVDEDNPRRWPQVRHEKEANQVPERTAASGRGSSWSLGRRWRNQRPVSLLG